MKGGGKEGKKTISEVLECAHTHGYMDILADTDTDTDTDANTDVDADAHVDAHVDADTDTLHAGGGKL